MRLKGNIIFELEKQYSNYIFKKKYKKEILDRIYHFLNYFLIRNSFPGTEGLKKMDSFFSIKNGEIHSLKEPFLNLYKEELFNSLNIYWYYKKDEKKELELEILNIRRHICSLFITEFLKTEKNHSSDDINYLYYKCFFYFFFKKELLFNTVDIDNNHKIIISKQKIDGWNLESTENYKQYENIFYGIPNNKFFKNISFNNKILFEQEKQNLLLFLKALLKHQIFFGFSVFEKIYSDKFSCEEISEDFILDYEHSYIFKDNLIFNLKNGKEYTGKFNYLLNYREIFINQLNELIIFFENLSFD